MKVVIYGMSRITPKQEKFIQGVIDGLTQREAYRQAYDAENMKDESVDATASKLLKDRKIALRYREILKETSKMFLWSREQSFSEYEWLKDKSKASIEQDGVKKATADAFLNSVDGMNKMAFRDLELADKKLKAEIEKLYNDMKQDKPNEDKVSALMDKIDGEIDDLE